MATGPTEVEALRQRLYRPGASEHDLATYLHASEAERPAAVEAAPVPDPGPSLRPFALGASLVASAAVLGGVLLSGVLTPPTVSPTTAASPAAVSSRESDGSWTISVSDATALDGGTGRGARGTAVQEGPDRFRYTVADGDTAERVAARFGVCTGDVLVALPYGVNAGRIPAGLTIELANLTSTAC